jgi:hypothetical protein
MRLYRVWLTARPRGGYCEVPCRVQEVRRVFKPYGDIDTVRFRSIAFESNALPRRVSYLKGQFHSKRDTMNGTSKMCIIHACVHSYIHSKSLMRWW